MPTNGAYVMTPKLRATFCIPHMEDNMLGLSEFGVKLGGELQCVRLTGL